MKMLEKTLATVLIFLILEVTLPIQIIAQETQILIAEAQNNTRTTDVTTIDLTQITTGGTASHTCVYETKYNTTDHWEECFICHKTRNNKTHNLVVTGKYGCAAGFGYQNESCADGCGYGVRLPKQPHTTNEWSTDSNRYRHLKVCTVCRNDAGSQKCTNENGELIGCVTGKAGTCVVCGFEYKTAEHAYTFDNGTCSGCGMKAVTYTSTIEKVGKYTTRITWKAKPKSSNIVIDMDFSIGSWSGAIPSPKGKVISATKNNTTGEITIVGELTFSAENAPKAEDSRCYGSLTIDGKKHIFNMGGGTIYPDNTAPTLVSVTAQGNGTASAFSKKAVITAKFNEEFDEYVKMALFDENGNRISNWETASRNGTTFTKSFDVIVEATGEKTITVKAIDSCENTGTGTIKVKYLDSKPPTLVSTQVYNSPWTKEKVVRFETQDEGSGGVQIAFNNETDYRPATYENSKYVRTYKFVGDVYDDVQGALYIKDALGNSSMQKITIGKIDNTAPTITSVTENLSANRKTANLVVQANDINTQLQKTGSGITGYQITTNATAPTSFQTSNTFNITRNGTYYLWAKDAVGNISQAKSIKVVDLEIDVAGNIAWNDNNNQYNSRIANKIKLYRKISGGQEEYVTQQNIVEGQTNYTFQTRQCDSNGNIYEFRIEQDKLPGYETLINAYNVTNNLILPQYTSGLSIEPKNSFQNMYLKNANIKLEAFVQASSQNRESVGVHNGTIQLRIDNNIEVDKESIKVNLNGTTINYSIQENLLTLTIPQTVANDKINIYLEGVLKEITNYNNSITYEGKLKDYQGDNTNINLGNLTQSTKQITVEKQLPEANIQFTKKDSITGKNLTNAEFTLYEWNGEEYSEIEKIKDENKDGVYESKVYRWNTTTQGKYKIVETTLPEYYSNIVFEMQYNLNKLTTQNYTITTDYNNNEYTIKYTPREPDKFKRQNGIVENEPWKAKIKIDKIDSETKNKIQSKAEFTIYEWNEETKQYENSPVVMEQQEDKTYLSNNWIYYTKENKGKFKLVETKAPFGYYGDYETQTDKNVHYIDILEWIQSDEGLNEGTISIGNNTITNSESQIVEFGNERVKASILAQLIDSETLDVAQGNATLEGAIYGLYALDNIYHSDGVTARYDKTALLYQKDELVKMQISGNDGKMRWEDLECGQYYIKMIQAPNGYNRDETKYKIDLSYETEEKESINQSGKIKIDVKKQAFELYKITENGEELENAGFSIYKIDELSIVKEGKIVRKTLELYELKDEKAKQDENLVKKEKSDGCYLLSDLINYYYKIQRKEGDNQEISGDEITYNPYKLENEQTAKDFENYNKEKEQTVTIKEIRTDKNGYMRSPNLAYGEYVVIETSVPRKHDNIEPFIIQITEDSEEVQKLRYVIDPNFRARVKIYLKDAKTNENIINNKSAYIIKNTETQELQTYTIKEDGKEDITYGTLENPFIIGKDGYLQTPMQLEVGEYIIEQVIAPQGYTKNGKEAYSEQGVINQNPREQVKIYVRSNNVYHIDEQTDNYVIVVTQVNEEVTGNIRIQAQGEFLNNVEIKEDGINTEYAIRNIKESEYELIAKEDITTQDGHSTLIYKKGDKVQTFKTKEETVILENLPQGEYEIKQIAHSPNFAQKKTIEEIAIIYETQEIPIIEKEMIMEEQRQKVKITIYNIDNQSKKAVRGGIYALYTKEDIVYINNKGETITIPANTLVTRTSANVEGKIEISAELNKDLPQGKYYLKEDESPHGYIFTFEEIPIDTTTSTGETVILRRKENEKEKTKIQLKNTDEKGNTLIGSKIEIVDETGIVQTIEKLEEINEIEKLQTQKKYTIKLTPVDGYTSTEEIEISITQKGELQIAEKYQDKQQKNLIVIKSEPTKLKIVTQDKQTKEKIEGIELEIQNENGKIITQMIQGEEAGTYYIQKLPIGKYKIIENKIPYEKGYVEKQEIEIKVENSENWQEVVIEQENSKVLIKIQDKETKELLKPIKIEIRSKDTKQIVASTSIAKKEESNKENSKEQKEQANNKHVEKIETTEEGYAITRLPVGKYDIIEQVQEGYKDIETKTLTIKDTKEWQNQTIENRKLIFAMEITKEIEEIRANGKKIELPKNGKVFKIDIRNKDVKKDSIEIQYVIQVKNTGEIEGTIGKIIDVIPSGLEYVEKEKGIWQIVGKNAECNKYTNKVLNPGEKQEVRITLRWKNSESNFGEKKNRAYLEGSTNKYAYKNSAKSTNTETQMGESSANIVISLSTGIENKITAIRITLIVLFTILILIIIIKTEVKYIEKKNQKIK